MEAIPNSATASMSASNLNSSMTTQTIAVALPQTPYNIMIGAGNLATIGQLLQAPELKLSKKVLVVSNPSIFKHYGEMVVSAIAQAGFTVEHCILPPGERYKTAATVQKIYDAALAMGLERSSTMVALGGGVVGDMTGFAAATWLRGINVIQVPTTLLAMVDSSIGGKTGMNHPKGKNLIGAFHQPRLVVIDPTVLKTLPAREFRAGMAEVIKYGVNWDRDLFEALEQAQRLDQLRYVSGDLLQTIVTHSCQAKAHVVTQDEKEAGLREILNYGHTIGHAVESVTGYRLINHGEGVAIGMVAAGEIAVAMDWWSRAECDRQNALIAKCGLPTQLPTGIDLGAIVAKLQTDKKVKAGQVRFVLPQTIGRVAVTDQVTPAVINPVLRAMQA
jgi:3-dehydroquinate synthase